jgi:Zinc carboxypeptidase
MNRSIISCAVSLGLVCAISVAFLRPAHSAQAVPSANDRLSNAFAVGWMLSDTNGDGVADAIHGKIVVPSAPTAAENAAAANWAARLSYGSAGITLPVVVTASNSNTDGPHVRIGREAIPVAALQKLGSLTTGWENGEGGVFVVDDDLVVVGKDDAGVFLAAASFAARSPYQWELPGDLLSTIPEAVTTATHGVKVELVGVTYVEGKQGLRRVFLRAAGQVSAQALTSALATPSLSSVHELILVGAKPVSAVNPKPMADVKPPKAEPKAESAKEDAEESEEEEVLELDLGKLYTSKGLFKGSAKMPLPSALKAHLYVPPGIVGVAVANFAARIALEGTGITLPLASFAADGDRKKVKTPVVLSSGTALSEEVEKKLRADEAAAESPIALSSGEGELNVVDRAFKENGAVLVRGDEAGSVAALQLLSGRFPNVWDVGKQYLSLDDIRYDLHRFFSLHSGVGQASVALYHLERWAKELAADAAGIRDVRAEVYVDLADPGFGDFVRQTLERDLHVSTVQVAVGSLHAGTQCCESNPSLHYQSPTYSFRQGVPTFSEDVVIPWEGKRLIEAVTAAASKIKLRQPVMIVARVSEGPEERDKLVKQIEGIVARAGVKRPDLHVAVLCAYKQGYSWLMDEIAPELAGKSLGGIRIEFAKDVDPSGMQAMSTSVRWIQELYPVDELLAQKLNLPLEKITFEQFAPQPSDPTYRVHVVDAAGKEILSRDFKVATVAQPYNNVMPGYEQVTVETGWIRFTSGADVLLDERIKTDIEEFWAHYQTETLPRIYRFLMSQDRGHIRPEYQPLFDTLRLDIHLSEPDYNIGLDRERISTLEALQEDTFYVTGNFINMMGHLEADHAIDYPGRILPIVHGSEDGKDGHVRIEFYGKPAANPLVRLRWIDAQGKQQERERNLPALEGPFQPRLIKARVKEGTSGVASLTWSIPADFVRDDYEEWVKVELRDRVEHTVFSVEQAKGQLSWLQQMHAAGLYADDLAYPHVLQMAMRFELPRPVEADENTSAPGSYVAWSVTAPKNSRPMISDYATGETAGPIVQWDEPISPGENEKILARIGAYPGVNVYWMGRSYLGQNLWAADVTLPPSSALRSWAKETTLKASVVYSGRQHANEVSSTSHVDKLGELLVTDPKTRALLKQVNVVLHPIDNSDGAQLSVDLAKITPDNLLHPGYHGSLSADVVEDQKKEDPIYPESRTRPQLIKAWLPDAFLNPHGYPSHEWVQPFSDYTGWVMSRQADAGREWWLPRGWFTSLDYLRDANHPNGRKIAFALRHQIVEAERNVPGLLSLEERMNARYQRFGQRWDPRYMAQPIVNGIRFYMALKGAPPVPEEMAMDAISPDVTWDDGYTEAPDETAHGEYLKLVSSAGLAFDLVHLNYLAQGTLRMKRTQKSGPDGVEWKVERKRPILPPSETAAAQKEPK